MILTLENINISFGGRDVFKNFSLSIKRGEITAITGPSGCGKTTLLNIISGTIKPDAGQVNNMSKKIGCIFQEDRLLPWKTVFQNILIVRENTEKSSTDKLISDVGLCGFENYYPHQLSGGMRQRCAIARAFNYEGELLLMDEPFSSLDINIKHDIMEKTLKLWDKTDVTIIFVTHNIDEAVFMADRIFILKNCPAQIAGVVESRIRREQSKDSAYINTVKKSVLALTAGGTYPCPVL